MTKTYRAMLGPAMGVVVITLAGCLACSRKTLSQATSAEQETRALHDFNRRVQNYIRIHSSADSVNPHIQATVYAEKIVDRQHTMAAFIQRRRGTVNEGALFTPEIQAYFGRAINLAYLSNEPGIQASLACVTPLDEKVLKPNTPYPEDASYGITPPTILLHLPALPPELEYRIVHRELLVRDREANLIVDIMRNAIRPVPRRNVCGD